MARIKGISQKVSPVDTLKLLALFFDAIILLASTGDDLRKCEQGVSSSSLIDNNPRHSSTFVIVSSFAACFFIFGVVWLVVKWCTDSKHYCNRNTKKWGHVSCSCSETAGEGKCICCECPTDEKNQCCCPSMKEKCHRCIRLVTYVTYDVISIIMGVLFLIGDNLTDDICVFYHCGNFKVNTTTCKLENKTNPVEGMNLTYNDCTNKYSTNCRRAAVACLGISTILNLFLLYLNFKSIYDKSLPSIGKDHKRWMATFNLLTLVIIFDQTITGLYQSVFKFTKNESNTCSDLTSVHLSAGFTFGISAVVWILILVFHCYTHWPGQGDCKSVSGFIVAVGSLFLFYIFFIFVDTPWPWECFDTNDWYIDFRRKGIELHLGLTAFSVVLLISFVVAYVIIVLIPTLCVKMKAGLTLDNATDVPDIIRKLPRWKSIPIERRNSGNNDSEERAGLLFASEYEEDMTLASYKVSFNKDYDWWSALRCKIQYEESTSEKQQQPPTPDSSNPSQQPTTPDSSNPSQQPTTPDTSNPSQQPTAPDTSNPSQQPTAPDSSNPSQQPTAPDTSNPSQQPTAPDTSNPSQPPTAPDTSGNKAKQKEYQAVIQKLNPKINQILPGSIVFCANNANGPYFVKVTREVKGSKTSFKATKRSFPKSSVKIVEVPYTRPHSYHECHIAVHKAPDVVPSDSVTSTDL